MFVTETRPLMLREEHRLKLFNNRVLRRIFGLKRDEVTGGWRKLCNEQLRSVCYSPNRIRMIKSRRMRAIGHVAHMGKMRNVYKISVENCKGKSYSEDLGVDGRIILKWILGTQGYRM
jgi:hypothetical protein